MNKTREQIFSTIKIPYFGFAVTFHYLRSTQTALCISSLSLVSSYNYIIDNKKFEI